MSNCALPVEYRQNTPITNKKTNKEYRAMGKKVDTYLHI